MMKSSTLMRRTSRNHSTRTSSLEGDLNGETSNITPDREVVQTRTRKDDDQLPTVNIMNLRNRTFITNPDDNGEQGWEKGH